MSPQISVAMKALAGLMIWSCFLNCGGQQVEIVPDFELREPIKKFVDPATPQTAGPEIEQHYGGAWELVFSDEFDGTSIDYEKWVLVDKDRGWKNGIHTYWREENILDPVEGVLPIRFVRESSNTFSAGNVNTRDKFEMAYGYYECRMHMAWPDGHQSAFWLMPPDGILPGGAADGTANDGAEIDIFEGNRQKEEYSTNVHWDGYGQDHRSSWVVVDNCAGLHQRYFNTFGLEWTPTVMRFFYNGELKRTVDRRHMISQVPEFVIVSGGIFAGNWVDGDIQKALLPDTMFVDFVRVFRREQMDYGQDYFRILHVESGLCLERGANGRPVLAPQGDSPQQRFQILRQPGGWYWIVNGSTLLVWDPDSEQLTFEDQSRGTTWRIDYASGGNIVRLINNVNMGSLCVQSTTEFPDLRTWQPDPSHQWEVSWMAPKDS